MSRFHGQGQGTSIAIAIVATVHITLRLHTAASFTITPAVRRPRTATACSPPRTLHLHNDITSVAVSSVVSPPPLRNHGELDLLTLDLDDTLFPIGPVVADANAAQLRALIGAGYGNASNEEIAAASKRVRTAARAAGRALRYTDLRKEALRREVARVGGGGDGAARDAVVDAAFDAWLAERHASADRHLFAHAAAALATVRRRHPGVVIGAVTNGRGDPAAMPSIAEKFDFCVSGEDAGVFPRRKPDRGIYDAAVGQYRERRREAAVPESRAGFTWVHVGDDLANDVGASARCGARTVWFATEDRNDEASEPPSWSTATPEELEKRVALSKRARAHVGAQIGTLLELPDAIAKVLSS